jgi:hypothetical protein
VTVAVPCAAQTPTPNPLGPGTTEAPAPPPPPVQPAPPDYPRGRINGYMFGDCYYNLDGNPAHVYDASGTDLGHPNINGSGPITKDLSGTQLRRIYFQLDNDLSARFSTRFRLEADGKSLATDGKMSVAVKNAYLQVRSLLPRSDFFFGMLTTPTFENSEEFWQHRAIEKTIVDFRGLVPSADFGIELKGHLDPDHHFGFSAMVGNGPGQKAENDRFKRFYLSLPIRFGDLRIEPYADDQAVRVRTDRVAPVQADSAAVDNDQATYKIFAGFEFRRVALGVEAVDCVAHMGPLPTQEPRGLSVFARGTATPTLGAFARLDLWTPDKRLASRVDSQLWIAGLDWRPFRDVHLMPNVEAVHYVRKGAAVAPSHSDIQARITFFYAFGGPHT